VRIGLDLKQQGSKHYFAGTGATAFGLGAGPFLRLTSPRGPLPQDKRISLASRRYAAPAKYNPEWGLAGISGSAHPRVDGRTENAEQLGGVPVFGSDSSIGE
jgi:hypothetical protein